MAYTFREENFSKEELNTIVNNLKEKVIESKQLNITESELRTICDIDDEGFYQIQIECNWLLDELEKDNWKDLMNTIVEDYIERYLS